MKALYFDISTAMGLSFGIDWERDFESIPEVTEIGYIYAGRGYQFSAPIGAGLDAFVDKCYDAELIVGCDLHRKVSAIKAQILRNYGREYYDEMAVGAALDKGKRIDLSLAAKQWAGMYGMDGKLHAPSIGELLGRCYPGAGLPGMIARERAEIVMFCTQRLLNEGIIELRQKPENCPISQV